MGPPSFDIKQRRQGRRYALECSGELDLEQTPILEAAVRSLCKNGAEEIELDLREVVFIDSAGISAIVDAMNECRVCKTDFSVVPTNDPGPRKVFEVLGLHDALPWRKAKPDG